MKQELFESESVIDILEDMEGFRGAYRTQSFHGKADFYRDAEDEDDRESFQFDHFSFDK